MNFNYIPLDDLNRAKQRISALLQQKYSSETPLKNNSTSEERNVNEIVVKIIQNLTNLKTNLTSVSSMIKITKSGSGFIQTISAGIYVQFFNLLSQSVVISKNTTLMLRNLERLNINFIEPDNVQRFFTTLYDYHNAVKYIDDKYFGSKSTLLYKFKTSSANGTEISPDEVVQINSMMKSLMTDLYLIARFSSYLENNYNYEGGQTSDNVILSKFSNPQFNED